jgi:hypothetical protein
MRPTQRITALTILTLSGIGIMTITGNYSCNTDMTGNGLPSDFQHLLRHEQVMVCAGCHPTEYAQELIGPHSHAFNTLTDHRSYVQSPDYDLDFYKTHIDEEFHLSCSGCHAPDNIYDDILDLNSPFERALEIYWQQHGRVLPKGRGDTRSRMTGVDCLNCHYDGVNVITGTDFIESPGLIPETSCRPKASKLFANDVMCLGCHPTSTVSDDMIYDVRYTGLDNCVSCHRASSADGQATHYIHWRREAGDIVRPDHLASVFHVTSVAVTDDSVTVSLVNDRMPHAISRGPEFLLELMLSSDRTQDILSRRVLRFNRKTEHDERMFEKMGNNTLPGLHGLLPGYLDTFTVSLPTGSRTDRRPSTLQLRHLSKGQYWFHDSTARLMSEKVFPLNLAE